MHLPLTPFALLALSAHLGPVLAHPMRDASLENSMILTEGVQSTSTQDVSENVDMKMIPAAEMQPEPYVIPASELDQYKKDNEEMEKRTIFPWPWPTLPSTSTEAVSSTRTRTTTPHTVTVTVTATASPSASVPASASATSTASASPSPTPSGPAHYGDYGAYSEYGVYGAYGDYSPEVEMEAQEQEAKQ